jgi:hypothetical protein
MSDVIRVPPYLYKRLESHASGFDSPANVIEKILDFYERNHHKTSKSTESYRTSHEPSVQKSYTSAPRATETFNYVLRTDSYTITSAKGTSETFRVPKIDDAQGIKELKDEVREFVKKQGGTLGQVNAATKKLTEDGYLN